MVLGLLEILAPLGEGNLSLLTGSPLQRKENPKENPPHASYCGILAPFRGGWCDNVSGFGRVKEFP